MHQKPNGKSYWLAKGEEKHYLEKILRSSLLGQPDVQGLGVLEFRSGEPTVFFRPVTCPSHEISETVTTASLVDDVMDKVLRGTVVHNDAWRSQKLAIGKESWVVLNVRDDQGGVKSGENVRGVG